MREENTTQEVHLTEEARAADSRRVFGLWVYLMTDFVLFACLFAVYAVLRGNTFGGPGASQIFNLSYVLIETILLLVSSLSCGLSLLAARRGLERQVVLWLGVTFALGASFVTMEWLEFSHLVGHGWGPTLSGFLSSYFALVGTHGLHVALGLLWMGALMVSIIRKGLSHAHMRKLLLLGMFWHFLEIVWVCIFTIVYLLGVI